MSDPNKPGMIDHLKKEYQKGRDIAAGTRAAFTGIYAWLNCLAVASIIVVRRKIGVRMIPVLPVLLAFFLISISGKGRDGSYAGLVGIAFLALAIVRRVRSGRDKKRVPSSIGWSWLLVLTRNRYRALIDCLIEPGLLMAAGYGVALLTPLLGIFMIVSAFGLMLIQVKIWSDHRNSELDRREQMLLAEQSQDAGGASSSRLSAVSTPAHIASVPHRQEGHVTHGNAASPGHNTDLDPEIRAMLDPMEGDGEVSTQNQIVSRH